MNSGKVLFTKSSKLSHNNLDVLTFIPQENLEWHQRLSEYISNLKQFNDRLAANYINISLNNYIAASVLLENDKIQGFSTVWNRSFYPKNTVRIFNRWWEAKRKVSKVVCSYHTISTMEHQIYFAKLQGFKWAFFSRDRNPRVIKTVSGVLSNSTSKKWHYHKDKIAVCHRPAPSCWQWVAYHAIFSNDNEKWSMLNG